MEADGCRVDHLFGIVDSQPPRAKVELGLGDAQKEREREKAQWTRKRVTSECRSTSDKRDKDTR